MKYCKRFLLLIETPCLLALWTGGEEQNFPSPMPTFPRQHLPTLHNSSHPAPRPVPAQCLVSEWSIRAQLAGSATQARPPTANDSRMRAAPWELPRGG